MSRIKSRLILHARLPGLSVKSLIFFRQTVLWFPDGKNRSVVMGGSIIDILGRIPLNASFLPLEGCVNFCSFCAENAGKKVTQYPFSDVRDTVETMPWEINNVALYNASDGLNYRWRDNGRIFTIADVAGLFLKKGVRRILFSTPGVPVSGANDRMLKRLAGLQNALFIFSLNREHLKTGDRLEGFIHTARSLMPHLSHQFRLVYTSPDERSRLLSLWDRHFKVSSRFHHVAAGAPDPETVPAVPIGRGRRFYFGTGSSLPEEKKREGEERVMDLYRREPFLADYLFMTAGDYYYFLKHAAVQFNGFYVILIRPGERGARLSLKVTDFSRLESTHGRHFSTEYRYDFESKSFVSGRDKDRKLKLIVIRMRDCTEDRFLSFLEDTKVSVNREAARDIFRSFMKSDFMAGKNKINENTRMIIMNKEYRDFYVKTLVTDILTFRRDLVDCHSLKKVDIGRTARQILAFLSETGLTGTEKG